MSIATLLNMFVVSLVYSRLAHGTGFPLAMTREPDAALREGAGHHVGRVSPIVVRTSSR